MVQLLHAKLDMSQKVLVKQNVLIINSSKQLMTHAKIVLAKLQDKNRTLQEPLVNVTMLIIKKVLLIVHAKHLLNILDSKVKHINNYVNMNVLMLHLLTIKLQLD